MSLALEGGKGYSRQTTTYQKRHYCMHSFTSHKGVHPRTWAWTGAWAFSFVLFVDVQRRRDASSLPIDEDIEDSKSQQKNMVPRIDISGMTVRRR
jgi:hypothetical protein